MTTPVIKPEDPTSEFEDFYTANFGDTVAMTYGYTADIGEAQDIAQEAFARAWQRWRDLSAYDNPVAWVRRVATNLAHSRWRRVRVAAGYLVRQRPPEPTPEIDPDHVAVVAALRKLPFDQRKAIVLHHLLDLPVAEVADELQMPVGTVKSLLYRGRNSLADDLSIDVRGSVKTPPAGEVVKLAKKHRRVRNGAVASVVVLILAGVASAVDFVRGSLPAPQSTSGAVATMDPDDPMLRVDWSNATIEFGKPPATCPAGPVRFAPMELGDIAIGPGTTWPKATFDTSMVAVGDLTGDGRAEAALIVTCFLEPETDDQPHRLLVVQRRADGSLHDLAWTGRPGSITLSVRISQQVLYANTRPHPSAEGGTGTPVTVDAWRWTGSSFEPMVR